MEEKITVTLFVRKSNAEEAIRVRGVLDSLIEQSEDNLTLDKVLSQTSWSVSGSRDQLKALKENLGNTCGLIRPHGFKLFQDQEPLDGQQLG